MSGTYLLIGVVLLVWMISRWQTRQHHRQWMAEHDSPFQYRDIEDASAAIRRKWTPEMRALMRIGDDGYPLDREAT